MMTLLRIPNLMFMTPAVILIITLVKVMLFISKKRKVYLVDFSCYKPKPSQKISKEVWLQRMRQNGPHFTDETMDFSRKLFERFGIGQATYVSEGLCVDPFDTRMAAARNEAEAAMFGALDRLLAKTMVDLTKIGVVVVNCSVFDPVPSLSAMVVNRYKLREDVVSYNLSGMGCSAGLVAVGLAKQLLQVHKDTYALVVSTENITQNFYQGNNRAMIIVNCAFRVGGAAILLSNLSSDRQLSKYELMHTVHNNNASSDHSYKCVFQEEDSEGIRGITTTKDLLAAAFKTVEANLTTLGPRILPVSDQLRFVANYIMRKLHMKNIKAYIPNFRGSIDHFYCHVGGKPVLDELQRNLKMSESDMEASRMTLYRWGNTASSSIWYELAYGEAKRKVKKRDRVWQIAFGSGFKCSSVIWRALRNVDALEELNPWSEEIDQFPVDLDTAAFPSYFKPSH